ncbi:MAG: hypothetical protein KVP17_000579 [Porospora cf. gigantea B]|uniref:uncharacterized protein n=1 Tax=Porospora cf. gigantea B TaxID=2853592 RepID=UPI003571CEBE|nr:MAG: hypothetical protein KVP17_000579 [Porospora cf. gigantea B]
MPEKRAREHSTGEPGAKLRDPADKSREALQALETGLENEFIGPTEDISDSESVVEPPVAETDQPDDGEAPKEFWNPKDRAEGELDYDSRAYKMFYRLTCELPCLSLDVIPDSLGALRVDPPHSADVVAGSQNEGDNCLYFMRWSNLLSTTTDGVDSDAESESDMEEARMAASRAPHSGVVNRVRVCPQLPRVVATWSSEAAVHLLDCKEAVDALARGGKRVQTPTLHSVTDFSDEGYGLAWSPHVQGLLAAGSCDGRVALLKPVEGGWVQDYTSRVCHDASVEDIDFKRTGDGQEFVMLTASVDRSIRLWDLRNPQQPAAQITDAHASDVNVISCNPVQGFLVLSGGDDGALRVWDIRRTDRKLASLQWHSEPVSSVQWHPSDESVFGCAALDDIVSVWDLSVEPDETGLLKKIGADTLPDQLLFTHMGQSHVSEIRWHPQIETCLCSTAASGFNIFQPNFREMNP